MDIALLIMLVGALVFLAHFFAWVFSHTAIPDGLFLIGIGLVLSAGLGVLTSNFFGGAGELILAVALVIMLFEGGTTLRLGMLKEAWSGTLRLTIIGFVLSFICVGLLVWWLTPLPLFISLMVGSIVAGTTSAVVIPLLEQLNVHPSTRAVLILESAVTDVLSIVVTIALLQALQTGAFSIGDMTLWVVVSFVYAAIVGIVGGTVWSLLLDSVRTIHNSIFITPAFVFLLYGFVEWVGFSGPIAALMFGITLGNAGALNQYLSSYHRFLQSVFRPVALSRRERAFLGEMVFLLQTFFFVYIGLSVPVTSWYVMGIAVLLSFAMLLLRILSVQASVSRATTVREASIMSVMIPKGLAAAVLASLLVQRGVESGALVQEIVYSVVLWSIVLTSVFIFLLEKTPLSRIYGWFLGNFGKQPLTPTETREVVTTP